jgi:hypothetical protein
MTLNLKLLYNIPKFELIIIYYFLYLYKKI